MDVDGTLLNSKGRLLPGTMEALRHCVRKGILLYLATARPRRLIFREEEVHGEVDFLKTRGVFYNGAIAVDDSIGAYTHWPIAGDTVSATVGFLETFASDIQIALQFEERHHSFRLPIDDSDLQRWGFAPDELVPFAEARAWNCSKIVAFHQFRELRDVCDHLTQKFDKELTVFSSDSGRWIQVMSRQATKERALSHLLSMWGISADSVVVFGDDSPDIGMFKAFPHSVAMGNASESVKEAAAYTTRRNDEEGIAYALREYFELI